MIVGRTILYPLHSFPLQSQHTQLHWLTRSPDPYHVPGRGFTFLCIFPLNSCIHDGILWMCNVLWGSFVSSIQGFLVRRAYFLAQPVSGGPGVCHALGLSFL